VLVAVSCQANLELPSDLVTDQRRSGGERDDRVDGDRFSDDEEDRVLRVMKAFEALVPELEKCGLGSDARSILADATALRDLRNRAVHSVMMFELREANQRLYRAWHAKSDQLWNVDPAELHELALKLATAASKTDDLGYNWEVHTGRSEPLETLLGEFLPELQDEP
jgi:hypothetical protein